MLNPPFVILDDHQTGKATYYQNPLRIITCTDFDEVAGALRDMQQAVDAGYYVAGYMAFELGYALEEKLRLHADSPDLPLLWFGVFEKAEAFNAWPEADATGLSDIQPAVDFITYEKAFLDAHRYIQAGDIYQINLTFPMQFHFAGNPLALYAALRRRQRVAHGAFIDTGEFHILSLSPELFFEISNGHLTGKPMKGTVARAAEPARDAKVAAALAHDIKCRAENLMIVDLMRNDFGRLAKTGHVQVPELFAVESYQTLHQMTSTVTAEIKPGLTVTDIVKAIFPSGSITGTPKIRAMQIIGELEETPRGIYTGAIGVFSRDAAHFNVAIRTLLLKNGRGQMGVGGGVVADSTAPGEYQEALLKARFLTDKQAFFQLFETMRWEKGQGYYLLNLHVSRMAVSARRFSFPFDEAAVHAALSQNFPHDVMRVKLLLDDAGHITVEAAVFTPPPAPWKYIISRTRLNPDDPFLYHKTTQRDLYTRELQNAKAQGADEVFFLNTHGELCEGSITNIFVELNGTLYTPPVACGLLPGTLRAEWLATGKAVERVLTQADLTQATAIYAGNSLHGLVLATPYK